MRSIFVILISVLINSCLTLKSGKVDENRIYNGRKASIQEFPYAVQLVMIQKDAGKHFTYCTGSIIKRDLVLTAAHCITPDIFEVAKSYYILAGTTRTLGEDGSVHNVVHHAIHPHYLPGTGHNDIAVVVVDRPFHYDDRRQAIRMAKGPLPTGILGDATGYGWLDPQGTLAEQLYTTILRSMSRPDCLRTGWMDFNVAPDNFCATNSDISSATCKGDSGGPFVVNHLLYGIVSQGPPYACYKEGFSTIYVAVWDHVSWIKSIARKRILKTSI